MKKVFKSRRGYTLVELILVVAIIIVLAGVMALSINEYIGRAKNGSSSVEAGVQSYQGKVSVAESKLQAYNF